MGSHRPPVYPYKPSPDQRRRGSPAHHPVIIVGAGPVGLTVAADLATRGIATVLLDEDDTVSTGSRAICWSKRTLEIFDRLGCADPMVARGITWSTGKVFRGTGQLYAFDLQSETGHRRPPFINLQQYLAEEMLVARVIELGRTDLRWKNRVTGFQARADGVRLSVETPDGPYELDCGYLIAADGARSALRRLLGLEFRGRVFEDRFLIADVRMKADFPTERWFWFDPPFNPGQSALLHRQADDVWRIDLQLGRDADPELERTPERVLPRLRAMLGPDRPFELEWVSVYTFQCRRLDRFRHGRVIFIGDAAHQVSPFGARGGNAGIQDADNLCWKLAAVLAGHAPEHLLDSYDAERGPANDENILNSTRSTDFITPKSKISRAFRDAVLDLAPRHAFARAMVNSGRLSVAAKNGHSALNTPDRDRFEDGAEPGTSCLDAPIIMGGRDGFLVDRVSTGGFVGLWFEDSPLPAELAALAAAAVPVRTLRVGRDLVDREGLVRRRYDATQGTYYLFRPDAHVTARWRRADAPAIAAARDRALGNDMATALRRAGE